MKSIFDFWEDFNRFGLRFESRQIGAHLPKILRFSQDLRFRFLRRQGYYLDSRFSYIFLLQFIEYMNLFCRNVKIKEFQENEIELNF